MSPSMPWGARLLTAAGLVGLVCATPGWAAIQEIEASGKYHLGDNDSRTDGHRLALLEAKRNALEKAGTYVESISEVKDYQLTRDDIKTYTAGLIAVEEINEPKWEMVGQQLTVTVWVKARVDPDVVSKKIGALHHDTQATAELRAERKKSEENEKKAVETSRQLKKVKKGSKKAKELQASRENAFAGIDSATLKAQGIAAKKFSEESWDEVKGFVNRNVDLHGCMPFKTNKDTSTASRESGLLVIGAPVVTLLLSKPRRRRRLRRACGERRGDDAANGKEDR